MSFTELVKNCSSKVVEFGIDSLDEIGLLPILPFWITICSYLRGMQGLHMSRHPCLLELRAKHGLPDAPEQWKTVLVAFSRAVIEGDLVCSTEQEMQEAFLHLFDLLFPWNGIHCGDVPVGVLALTVSQLELPRTWSTSFTKKTILEVIQRAPTKIEERDDILSEQYVEALKECLRNRFGLVIGLNVCPLLREEVEKYILSVQQKQNV